MDFDGLREHVLSELESGLDSDLGYHSVSHTLDVIDAVERLGRQENVPADAIVLLKTAALMHDTGFLVTYRNNEPDACVLTRELLPNYGYSPSDVEQVCQLVMATTMPQNPDGKLAEIICDADLYYLGTDSFEENADKLRAELACHGTVFTDREWLELQVRFLEDHHYFTETARKSLGPVKQTHLQKVKENDMLNNQDNGE